MEVDRLHQTEFTEQVLIWDVLHLMGPVCSCLGGLVPDRDVEGAGNLQMYQWIWKALEVIKSYGWAPMEMIRLQLLQLVLVVDKHRSQWEKAPALDQHLEIYVIEFIQHGSDYDLDLHSNCFIEGIRNVLVNGVLVAIEEKGEVTRVADESARMTIFWFRITTWSL